MATSALAALYWARSAVSEISALGDRVYALEAPQGAVLPFAVVNVVSSRDSRVAGQERILEIVTVQLDIFTKAGANGAAGFEELATIASLADTLLESQNVRNLGPHAQGFRIFSAVRQTQQVFMDPDRAGARIPRQMSTYEVHLQRLEE